MEELEEIQDDDFATDSSGGNILVIPLMSLVTHPVIYVKLLIQVGYEPLPPKETISLFGRKVLRLPNFFQYAGYIKNVDGWFGLYRGLGPRVAFNYISSSLTSFDDMKVKEENDAAACYLSETKAYLQETWDLSVSKTFGIFVGYPFRVISIRMMAQFVGKETCYSSVNSSIKEIYQEEGFIGFFNGIVPYLVGELVSFIIFRILNYKMLNFTSSNENSEGAVAHNYFLIGSHVLSSTLTYPLQLVANIMTVNGSRSAAAGPSMMPVYSSWMECWIDLGKKGLRSRGIQLFLRTVNHF